MYRQENQPLASLGQGFARCKLIHVDDAHLDSIGDRVCNQTGSVPSETQSSQRRFERL
jgi:hypothetical protein